MPSRHLFELNVTIECLMIWLRSLMVNGCDCTRWNGKFWKLISFLIVIITDQKLVMGWMNSRFYFKEQNSFGFRFQDSVPTFICGSNCLRARQLMMNVKLLIFGWRYKQSLWNINEAYLDSRLGTTDGSDGPYSLFNERYAHCIRPHCTLTYASIFYGIGWSRWFWISRRSWTQVKSSSITPISGVFRNLLRGVSRSKCQLYLVWISYISIYIYKISIVSSMNFLYIDIHRTSLAQLVNSRQILPSPLTGF